MKFHGGNLNQILRIHNIDAPEDVIDFSVNINPLGMPEKAKTVLQESLNKIKAYPDDECVEFREAAGGYHSIDNECVTAVNGAAEGIDILVQALRPDLVHVFMPTFSEYTQRAAVHGIPCSETVVPYKKYSPLEYLPRIDSSKKGIVFICNPNNPTGTLIPAKDILREVDKFKDQFWVIDEAFLLFAEPEEEQSLAQNSVRMDNLAVLRSMTKIISIPGLRLGYITANPDLSAKLRNIKIPWSVNTAALEAGKAGIDCRPFFKKTAEFIKDQRNNMEQELSKVKSIHLIPSNTNYIMADITGTGLTSTEVQKKLLTEHRILVRDCNTFNGTGNNCIRMAVKQKQDNTRLIKAITDIF